MDTHDIDGTPYQNENRRFYAPEKEAEIQYSSHAYSWASGQMYGSCSETTGAILRQSLTSLRNIPEDSRYPVDTIHFESAALFLTDSNELTVEGQAGLSQAIERLEQYSQILHLTVEGHADYRGSTSSNQTLSESRAKSIALKLSSLVPSEKISIQASGENKPLVPAVDKNSLGVNRRVSIVAIVSNNDRTPNRSNSASAINTKCHRITLAHDKVLNPNPVDRLESRIAQSLQNPHTDRPPLSVGDRIRLIIPEGEELTGIYEVGLSGAVEIPFIGLIQVQGLTTEALENTIHERLIEEEIFRPGMLRVSTTVQEWAPVDVLVSGATFDPGRVTINRQEADYRTFKQSQLSGDFAKDRFLSAALFSAGGVRPDADLEQVRLIRKGEVQTVNMRGLFDGNLTKDIPLAAGDQVVVPSLGYFQPELVLRTQVTPPGIRIFISNLTAPALSNSQSAVNSSSTSMPYGTRFLQGIVSANCVGGTQLTNAARRAVLISTNPLTKRTEVIERSIQQLVSDPARDDINPFLMPNDAIACYDSGVTNFRDVTRTFSEFLIPILGLSGIN